jgi:hypothetical protein
MAPPAIVKDSKYPQMYRIKWEDGSLSDMANLSRIKDALRRDQETMTRKGRINNEQQRR